jgi:hypothetical protein
LQLSGGQTSVLIFSHFRLLFLAFSIFSGVSRLLTTFSVIALPASLIAWRMCFIVWQSSFVASPSYFIA